MNPSRPIRAIVWLSWMVVVVLPLSCIMHAASTAEGVEVSALATRSMASGSTMFTLLSPTATGVVAENRYADPQMWANLYQEHVYGAIGTGVAIGDYDGDGRPDLFIVSKTGQSRLFRNLGEWRFADVTTAARLAPEPGWWAQGLDRIKGWFGEPAPSEPAPWTQGATFVDVNNDGRLDLYVCRFATPNQLFVNQGDGTFTEEAAARGLAVTDASGMAAFADYDRDGWLDVYLQTNLLNATSHPKGQRDHLLRNRGNGTFENVTDRAGIGGETAGHSATWWDFDHDGWPDVYVANDFATPDQLYRNNHDGTFTDVIATAVPSLPYYAMGADLGDVNNDGRMDFFVADMAPTNREADQRGMAGSRARAQLEPADPAQPPQLMRNALYLNTGTPHLREGAWLAGLAASDWTWSARFEDLDNDGRIDLHITNGMTREYHNADLLARIMAAENPAEARQLMRASPVLAEHNLAFRNHGDLRFESVGPAWGLDQHGVSFGAAFGDLDGDGDLDLVFANHEAGPTLLRNDSPSGRRLVVALRGTRSNRFGAGAEVQLTTGSQVQVRQLTLARGYLSSSEPIVHFGLGDADIIERLVVRWPSGVEQTLTAIPADRRLVITEPSVAPLATATPGAHQPPRYAEVSATLGLDLSPRFDPQQGAKPQPLLPWDLNRRGPALAVADFDGDGHDDVALGGTTLQPARLLFAVPDQPFRAVPLPRPGGLPGTDDGPLLAFDADGDSDLDLLVTRGGVRQPAGSAAFHPDLWCNDGRGRFALAPANTLPSLPLSAGAVTAADFDRDGDLDVFLGGRVTPGVYPRPGHSALLRNRGGTFEDVTSLAPALAGAGLVTSALWTDVDDDGWPDLLVALEWGGVRYWHNDAGEGFTEQSAQAGFAAAGTGGWTSLGSADFNGDGRLDYVAGNLGLNTPYQASAREPLVAFFGEFTRGAPPLLVETVSAGGRRFPRRTRNELAAYLPALLRRFPSTDRFASATLEEVLGSAALADADRYTITELRSGVFLSQPDGRFVFSPLPREAQLAPWQGLVAGDFDADGNSDLYVVENSHAPVASIGHFAGGLSQLWRGDGLGGFVAVPAAESGLVVPGDAEAVVMLGLTGTEAPGLLISRHRASLLAYRSRPASDQRRIAITLRGPAGNPTAVGARLQVIRASSRSVLHEVQSASSYMSQSTATVFLAANPSDPWRELRVRWPNGRTSRHFLDVSQSRIAIHASASASLAP